jgi:Mor family transcriptional regulator
MTKTKHEFFADRNAEIIRRKEAGERIKNLAIEFNLTESGIKQVLAKMRGKVYGRKAKGD